MAAGVDLALKICSPKKFPSSLSLKIFPPSLYSQNTCLHSLVFWPPCLLTPTLFGWAGLSRSCPEPVTPIPGILLWGKGERERDLEKVPDCSPCLLLFKLGSHKAVAHIPPSSLCPSELWDHTPEPQACPLSPPPSPCLCASSY